MTLDEARQTLESGASVGIGRRLPAVQLGLGKAGIVVNAGRGKTFDEQALYEALKDFIVQLLMFGIIIS